MKLSVQSRNEVTYKVEELLKSKVIWRTDQKKVRKYRRNPLLCSFSLDWIPAVASSHSLWFPSLHFLHYNWSGLLSLLNSFSGFPFFLGQWPMFLWVPAWCGASFQLHPALLSLDLCSHTDLCRVNRIYHGLLPPQYGVMLFLLPFFSSNEQPLIIEN